MRILPGIHVQTGHFCPIAIDAIDLIWGMFEKDLPKYNHKQWNKQIIYKYKYPKPHSATTLLPKLLRFVYNFCKKDRIQPYIKIPVPVFQAE